MRAGVVMRAAGRAGGGVIVEQMGLGEPVRLMAIGTLGMTVDQISGAQLRARLQHILAPAGVAGAKGGIGGADCRGADVMHLGRAIVRWHDSLLPRNDRHAIGKREIILDVGHCGKRRDDG